MGYGVPTPGDMFFTTGAGIVGWVTRHGSASHWAHCGVVVDVKSRGLQSVCDIEGLDCSCLGTGRHGRRACMKAAFLVHTIEAFPDGLLHRYRWLVEAGPADRHRFRLVRFGRTPDEQAVVVSESKALARRTRGYDWGEILRIAGRMVGVKVRARDVAPDRNICSGAVALAGVAARPELAAHLPHAPHAVWPGVLRECVVQLPGVHEIHGWVPVGEPIAFIPEEESK